MSLRPYRPRKRKATAPASQDITPPQTDEWHSSSNRARLVPVDEVPRRRLAPFTSQYHFPRVCSVLTLPDGRELTQLPQFRGHSTQVAGGLDPVLEEEHRDMNGSLYDANESPMETSSPYDMTPPYLTYCGTEPTELRQTRARAKKERQWKTWAMKTIPSLLSPYLQLLRETNSLRDSLPRQYNPCPCGVHVRRLKVVCVYFESESPFC